MRHDTIQIMERRSKTLLLLAEGLTASEISKQTHVSIEQVYDDLRCIKKDGHKFIRALGSKNLGYSYHVLITNLFHVNKDLWQITKDNEIMTSDKIRAYKTIVETTNTIKEIFKESINMITIEEMKKRIEDLELISNPDSESKTHSYIDIKQLPHINSSLANNKSTLITDTNVTNEDNNILQ